LLLSPEYSSPSSFQLTVEDENVQKATKDYIEKLSPIIDGKDAGQDVIGYAFAINGEINSADVYASGALFRKLWPKLINATSVEALAAREKDAKRADAPTEQAVADYVADYLEQSATAGEPSEKKLVDRVIVTTREDDKSIYTESRDRKRDGQWIHRSYLRK